MINFGLKIYVRDEWDIVLEKLTTHCFPLLSHTTLLTPDV